MLGKPKSCEPKLFYHGVSIEQRIPANHVLRQVKRRIDFDFVRSQVAPCYGKNGHPSLDPALVLKFLFLLFFQKVSSERDFFEQLPLRLDWLWFCDYDLDEPTPNHSVLSKARKRWGPKVFDQFFLNILEQCHQAGLINGQTIHVDSSQIAANAAIERARPQLRQVCRQVTDKLDDAQANTIEDGPEDGPDAVSRTAVSPVDPDARIGSKPGETVLGYKDTRAVDDQCGIITATITTPADVHDAHELVPAVAAHEANTACEAGTVVTDSIYGTADNYQWLQQQGKRCCIPHQRHGTRTNPEVSHDRFRYDPQRDCYICPAGELLHRYDQQSQNGGVRYRAARAVCEACRYFKDCVQSRHWGRQIRRNDRAEIIAWADNCGSREHRRRLQARRRYKAEGSFADAANNHGFKRARWRGLASMQIQNLLIAAIQNLRKLLRYDRFGRANHGILQPHAGLGAFFSRAAGYILLLIHVIAAPVSEYAYVKERAGSPA